ncbi:MAG: ATP-binding protein [Spirochaetota bacterium]
MAESFSTSIERSVDALDRFRMEFMLRLETAGLDEEIIAQLELCSYEVLINIIEHTPEELTGPVHLHCIIHADSVVLELRYQGDGFDPSSQTLPDLASHFGSGRKRGLGIYIIHTLMDTLDYSEKQGLSLFRMTKKL